MTYAIILAGGTGTRFWPFSRELEPKQFIQMVGKTSLFQDTIKRLDGVVAPKNVLIITNRNYFYEIKNQVRGCGIPEVNIILEPQGKNTAPAIGLAARLIIGKDKDAVMIVLPADHYIKDLTRFKGCLKRAVAASLKGMLVTLGVKPSSPSTGYGYIKVKPGRGAGYFCVEKFLEKPNLDKAKEYFRNKRFYWNSGMFIWRADLLLEEFKRFLPDLYRNLSKISCVNDIEKAWPKMDSISVDYGIMEHSKKIALIPADFDWTDLGSWDALNELLPKNKDGNLINGDCLEFDNQGLSVFSRANRLIAAIGLKDLIIADTPDALLVCDKHKTQDVRMIVEKLKSSRRREHVTHVTEKRPWGRFTVLQNGDSFKIKFIEIDPGKRLSLQRHKKRAEHWVVVSGCAKVTTGRKAKLVPVNHSIYVPMGAMHRLENPYKSLLKIVEVQTGSYLEEDDIERFSDDYQR